MRKSRPELPSKYFIVNVRGLVLIYVLLCVLTILFSRAFFSQTLETGVFPDTLNRIVFFTIPVVLLVFLAASSLQFIRDMVEHRSGSRFQARIMGYFIIIVGLSATPVTVITFQAATELARFWKVLRINDVLYSVGDIVMDAYSLQVERLENLVREGQVANSSRTLPARVAAIQDFSLGADGSWTAGEFRGDETKRLPGPPSLEPGFVNREIPRDMDMVRYVFYPGPEDRPGTQRTNLRLVSYSIGPGFDQSFKILGDEQARFDIINSLEINLRPLLIFYYGVFFFPTLLMTVIIAISFTRRIAQPIIELTDATHRVAQGDFSIQILARPGDELGRLIGSFNAMVQDLENSRSARVKEETISIWQNMAQQLAHEIKNPLTPIRLSAERVLRRWQNDPERLPEILESSMLAIIQEVEGLSTLLGEFRTLSRPLEPSQSWTRVKEAVEESIGPYRSSHPNIRFDLDHVEGTVSIKIDKHRLVQALTNLIINSIDAMNSQGSLEIRTDLVKKRESHYCRISIKDTGKGITKQEGAQIFTPYFTTKESGTGLGLPIVERIVNDHGGTIWFNSAEGAGTTFFIDLPVEKPSIEGIPSGNGEKIP